MTVLGVSRLSSDDVMNLREAEPAHLNKRVHTRDSLELLRPKLISVASDFRAFNSHALYHRTILADGRETNKKGATKNSDVSLPVL